MYEAGMLELFIAFLKQNREQESRKNVLGFQRRKVGKNHKQPCCGF
jgi:hypothetical protein